jgi:hypothetical protein
MVGGEKTPIWYFFSEKNWIIKNRIPVSINHTGPKNINKSKYKMSKSSISKETCGLSNRIKTRMK